MILLHDAMYDNVSYTSFHEGNYMCFLYMLVYWDHMHKWVLYRDGTDIGNRNITGATDARIKLLRELEQL